MSFRQFFWLFVFSVMWSLEAAEWSHRLAPAAEQIPDKTWCHLEISPLTPEDGAHPSEHATSDGWGGVWRETNRGLKCAAWHLKGWFWMSRQEIWQSSLENPVRSPKLKKKELVALTHPPTPPPPLLPPGYISVSLSKVSPSQILSH